MTQQNLPAYLQQYSAPDVGAALSANLGSAMPPHVSIGGGRFTLVDSSNNEIPVPTFDPVLGVYLDAAIIDTNPVMSRIYFAGSYDPGTEGVRPDCFSDNGIGPSISASNVPVLKPPHPMAGMPARSCAECPMAEWTKINNNGKKVPWCSQKQKVALLIPGFPTLFLLAVPPNSHSYLREYVEKCKGNGANVANLITRISFVPGVQGTLQFQPVSWIDQAVAELRQAAYAEKKTDMLVGRNDVARPAGMIAAPAQQPLNAAQLAPAHQIPPPTQQWPQQVQQPGPFMQAGTPSVGGAVMNQPFSTAAAPFAGNPAQPASQQVQQPGPFVQNPTPSATWPAPAGNAGGAASQPATGSPTFNPGPAQNVSTTSPSEPAPGKRRRRTAAEMQAANGAAPGGQPPQTQGQAPQAPFPHPGQQAQAQFPQSTQAGALPGQTDTGFGIAQGQPAAANPELAGMLDDFFKQG